MAKSLDSRLQTITDDALGFLQERGVTPATILREMTVTRLLSVIAVYVVIMQHVPLGVTALLVIAMSIGTVVNVARWKGFNDDANKDWSESLSKKYSDRALKYRETRYISRMISIGMLFTAAAIETYLVMDGYSEYAVVILVLARCLIELISDYIDSSIPAPPKQRRMALVPAAG